MINGYKKTIKVTPEEFSVDKIKNFQRVVKNQLGHPDPVYTDQARVNVKYQKKLMELENVITLGNSIVEDNVLSPDLSYCRDPSQKLQAIMSEQQFALIPQMSIHRGMGSITERRALTED